MMMMMHVRYHLATTVLLVFFPSSALMTTADNRKSFAKLTSFNGTELCSADPPSSVFQVGGSGSKSCEGLPPSVQCAQRCTQLQNSQMQNSRTWQLRENIADAIKSPQLAFDFHIYILPWPILTVKRQSHAQFNCIQFENLVKLIFMVCQRP